MNRRSFSPKAVPWYCNCFSSESEPTTSRSPLLARSKRRALSDLGLASLSQTPSFALISSRAGKETVEIPSRTLLEEQAVKISSMSYMSKLDISCRRLLIYKFFPFLLYIFRNIQQNQALSIFFHKIKRALENDLGGELVDEPGSLCIYFCFSFLYHFIHNIVRRNCG